MRILPALLVVVSSAFLVHASGIAQEDEAPKLRNLIDVTAAEQGQMQVRAFELAQPAAEHRKLVSYAGEFDHEIQMWMSPQGDPLKARGRMKHEAVLGGRYLRVSGKYRLSVPGTGDLDVESIQYLGFDRHQTKYTSMGLDTMSTYATLAEGMADEATGNVKMSGKTEDPLLGIQQVYDIEIEFVDADTLKTTLIVHDAFVEGPFKLMETISRRRKE